MRTIATSLLSLALLAAGGGDAPAGLGAQPPRDVGPGQAPAREKDKETKRKPNFTVGKETTYVTGPLDEDGYVDYAAALNERLSRGIKPEDNANVLLWRALGPRPEGGAAMPPEFFKWL